MGIGGILMLTKSARFNYTKLMLQTSLVQLMQKKMLDDITIKELCNVANVNRSTFYAHYRNTYEIMIEIIEQNCDLWINAVKECHKQPDFLAAYTKILTQALLKIKDDNQKFRVLCSDECFFLFVKTLTNYIVKEVLPHKSFDLVWYNVEGGLGAVRQWYFDGAKEPAEELSQHLAKISYKNLFLDNDND